MEKKWIRAHGAAQFEALPMAAARIGGKTIRASVTLGLGGEKLRLILAQNYGGTITYGNIKVGVGNAVYPVTWEGSPRLTLRKGQQICSDSIDCAASAGTEITLWFYIENETRAETACIVPARHSCPGDYTGETFLPEPGNAIFGEDEPLIGYCGMDVFTTPPRQVIAVLGDSITAMELWTKPAQRALLAEGAENVLLNLGISGERLLLPTHIPAYGGAQHFGDGGLARLGRDILRIPGITQVVVALGVNDISQPGGEKRLSPPIEERCTAEGLIAGFREVIRQCRQRGLTIYGCTITPFGEYLTGNPETCRIRSEVNDWIRSGEFDGVIDFAACTADPADPDRYLPEYDSGDHLHPSAAGGEAMARAFLRNLSAIR